MLDLSKVAKTKEREKRLLQKIEAAQAKLKQVRTRQKKDAGTADAHRKIVLGVCLLAGMKAGTISAETVRGLIEEFASESGRKAFAGTAFAVDGTGPESTVPDAPEGDVRG